MCVPPQALAKLQDKRVAVEKVVLHYGEAPSGIKEVFELCRGFERAYVNLVNVSLGFVSVWTMCFMGNFNDNTLLFPTSNTNSSEQIQRDTVPMIVASALWGSSTLCIHHQLSKPSVPHHKSCMRIAGKVISINYAKLLSIRQEPARPVIMWSCTSSKLDFLSIILLQDLSHRSQTDQNETRSNSVSNQSCYPVHPCPVHPFDSYSSCPVRPVDLHICMLQLVCLQLQQHNLQDPDICRTPLWPAKSRTASVETQVWLGWSRSCRTTRCSKLTMSNR